MNDDEQPTTRQILDALLDFRSAVEMRFTSIDERFTSMQREMDRGFASMQSDMNRRFDRVDERFDRIDKRFEQAGKPFS